MITLTVPEGKWRGDTDDHYGRRDHWRRSGRLLRRAMPTARRNFAAHRVQGARRKQRGIAVCRRRKQVIRAGIPRFEETVATALLRNSDGAVAGLFCLDALTGEYTVVEAKAVIMATGYSDRLHKRSTGTREMSADGIAMAWRAGAALVNMEMQWWHTNDIANPPSWQRMQVYPNPMLGSEKSARMVNSNSEELFNQQQDDPLAFGPYTVQLKALAKQVHAGKARYDGGYFAGFDHCDVEEVDRYTTYG